VRRAQLPGIYPSAVTDILVPSDCTLMLPWLMFRLLAVSHHPVGALLPPSIRKPFSSRRFCVSYMSERVGGIRLPRKTFANAIY
jgi:hypothetical protein